MNQNKNNPPEEQEENGYPTGDLSVKYFSQVSEKRFLVRHNKFLKTIKCQMCITEKFVALLAETTHELIDGFQWEAIDEVYCTKNPEEFIIVVNGKKQKMLSSNRAYAFCELQYYHYLSNSAHYLTYNCQRIKPNGVIYNVAVQIRPYGIVEVPKNDKKNELVRMFCDMKCYVMCSDSNALAIVTQGNEKEVYVFMDREMAMKDLMKKTEEAGMIVPVDTYMTMEDVFNTTNIRKAEMEEGGSLVEIRANHGVGKKERIICFTEQWFVERDSVNYGICFAKPLHEIVHICRGKDVMEVIVSFTDGTQKFFLTTQRENFIAALFDCCLAAKCEPIVSDMPRYGSLTIERMTLVEQGLMETTLLKNIALYDPQKVVDLDPKELFMVHLYLLNSNTPINGPQIADSNRSKLIGQALEKVLFYGRPGESFLQCVYRLMSTRMGYETFVQNKHIMEKVLEITQRALTSIQPMVLFWALRICGLMLCSTADENTEKRGKLAVMRLGLHLKIFETFIENIKRGTPFVIYGCVTALKFIVCDPYANTTEFGMFNETMRLIGGLGRKIFTLFQSPCISVPHIAGQMLKTLIEETDLDEKIKELQDFALLEGITLQYLETALFLQPKTITQELQRHLAIHLLDIFTYEHKDTGSMFDRILPKALLKYLESKEQPPEQIDGDDSETRKGVKQQQMNKALAYFEKWNRQRRDKEEGEIRTRQRHLKKRRRNWGMLIYQLHQQHRKAELVWNHQTMQELKEAISNELRNLKKDQEDNEVAWNHREFIVDYNSLKIECCVDGCFVKCLLEQETLDLSDPREFLDTLYHRCLFETDKELQGYSIQAMGKIYRQYHEEIGTFKDIAHIVAMLRETRTMLIRDRLIDLIEALLIVETNARRFIDCGGIDLYVELLTLVHLHSDHAIIPLQSNLLTAGATSGEWFYAEILNDKKEKKGPISLIQMEQMVKRFQITENTLVWAQGMEDWKPLKEVTCLKWAMLKEGTGIYTPIELCTKVVATLEKLVTMYPSRDMHGILLRPIPRAKRILSTAKNIPHVVQLLLTSAPQVMDIAARLIKNILDDNPSCQPKFYLTGAFYFALMYTGSNLKEIARLLYTTHRQQKMGDAIELSILKPILPPSLINVLDRSADEFAARFVGEVATPEIRWNSSMRNYLIDTLSQHVGDFPSRLASNPLAVYSHVPIAPLVYEELKDELYCGRVYLRELCDEETYPDYEIKDPVGMLQSILRTWVEVAEAPLRMSKSEACQILGVENAEDKQKLRKAYYKLAQKYHPDKNPEGRDMFEKINEAYNNLVNVGPDNSLEKVKLIIHAQCILYRRCGEVLAPYKYAGYGLLIPIMENEEVKNRAQELVYFTIRASSLNIQELARQGGMKILLKRLDELCSNIVESEIPTIRYILRAMAVAAKYPNSLEDLRNSVTIIPNVQTCLSSDTLTLVEPALECISMFSASDETMRLDMYERNFIGYLIKRVMQFDPTLDEVDQQSVHRMKNAIAGMSLIAMKALVNIEQPTEQTRALFSLFTPQMGMMMRNGSVSDALTAVTSTTQTPYLIWNNRTRKELMDYIDAHIGGTMDWSPREYLYFRFESLENEFTIDRVYIRIFNEQIRTCEPLPDPMRFLKAAFSMDQIQNPEWIQWRAIALSNVFETYDVIEQVCSDDEMLQLLFGMLKEKTDDLVTQKAIFNCIKRTLSNAKCVEIIAKHDIVTKLFTMLYPSEFIEDTIPLIQTLYSVTIGLQQGIHKGGLVYLLNHFINNKEFENRAMCAQLISKMATTPGIGPKVSLMLIKFFPQSIVHSIKVDPRRSVSLIDTTTETPELIWNAQMKHDIGDFVVKMVTAYHNKQLQDPTIKWQVPDTFNYRYKELENELVIGGIFIRVLMKHPSTPLTSPNVFSDGLFSKYQEAAKIRHGEKMETIAKAAAVFYTNQPNCLQYLPSSGHLTKLMEIVKKTPHESAFTILQVVVSHKGCKEKLIDENAVPIIATLVSRHLDQAKVMADIFRSLTEDIQCKNIMCFIPKICSEQVQNSLFYILDGKCDEVLGADAQEVKALIVDGLQNCLKDYNHAEQLTYHLEQHPSWAIYSQQKHSLYLTGAPSIAGYLTGPTSTANAVGLLMAAEDSSYNRPDLPPDLK